MKLECAIKSETFKNETHKASLNILYTAWWLKTIVSTHLKSFGLTHEQYNVLRILKGMHSDKICVREIACRMIEKNSNVPRIIDRLEVKKYVQRTLSQTDKRETLISLTEIGVNTLEKATKKINKLFDATVLLEESEAHQLNELLEKVRYSE